MSEFVTMLMMSIGRMSLAIVLAALVTEFSIRYWRVKSPAWERLVWELVLVQGIWFVPLSISLPLLTPETQSVAESNPESSLAVPNVMIVDQHAQQIPPPTGPQPQSTTAASNVVSRTPLRSEPDHVPTSQGTGRSGFNIAACFFVLWMTGIVGLFLVGLLRYVRFISQLKARPRPLDDWTNEWNEVLRHHRITRPIKFVVTDTIGPALVRAPGRYQIVVPQSDWASLTSGQRRAILEHELAHYLRGDIWSTMAARIVLLVHWFNPVAWMAVKRFEQQSEYLCDEFAGGMQPEEFASALIQLGSKRTASHFAVHSVRDNGLFERVQRLLTEKPRASFWRIAIVGASLLVPMAVCQIHWRLVAAEPTPKVRDQVITEVADEKIAIKQPESRARGSHETAKQETSSNAMASITGPINLIDGSPATIQGWLYSHVRSANGNSSSGTVGRFRDRFEAKVPPGKVMQHYYVPGYAPAAIGPVQLDPGAHLDHAGLELKRGKKKVLHVVSPENQPVAGAILKLSPQYEGYSVGPSAEAQSNADGDFELTDLGETPYSIELTAKGFQRLRIPRQIFEPNVEPLIIRMAPSKPATGIVRNPDGSPAAHASFYLLHEIDEFDQHFFQSPLSQLTPFAETDAQGRFALDQLSAGADYLIAVVATVGTQACGAIRHDINAGQEGLSISLSPRPIVQVQLNGDISALRQIHRNKRCLDYQQRIEFRPKSGRTFSCLFSGETEITPNATGGRAQIVSLCSVDPAVPESKTIAVSITPGDQYSHRIELNSEPETSVTFELPRLASPSDQKAELIRGPNYLVVPCNNTPLQDDDPKYKVYVLVDGKTFFSRDGRLDQDAINWNHLIEQLLPFARQKPSVATFHTFYFSNGLNLTNNGKDLLNWAWQGFGSRAGFTKTHYAESQRGPGDFWEMIDEARTAQGDRPDGEELPIGNQLVQVFPVETFLSRIRNGNADAVVKIAPRITKEMGDTLPQDIQDLLHRYVRELKTPRRKRLNIHVNYNSTAGALVERLRQSQEQLAHELQFEKVGVISAEYDE